MGEAYIVDGVRTGIGKFGGSLATVRPDDLSAHVISALVKRHPTVDPSTIQDVILGCANQAGEDNRNVARMALLLAGLPASVPGETVNRLCASGMSAVVQCSRAIRLGEGDYYIAGGVEHMTRAPFVLAKSSVAFGRDAEIYDTSIGWRFINKRLQEQYGTDSMGETAENVAERYKISREDQDLFALHSQRKASAAKRAGRFEREIAPLEIPQRKGSALVFKDDEYVREDSSLEALAQLRPVFRAGGSVTAGNASGINDGACALLLASRRGIESAGLEPLARVVASAAVGVEPRVMGIGPVEASKKAVAQAGINLDQIDVIELNEAFAAQSLACLRELGIADNDPRVNPNGGAIALGHPLGMSGARIILSAAHELKQSAKRYALCTMCIGVGQGMATVIERV